MHTTNAAPPRARADAPAAGALPRVSAPVNPHVRAALARDPRRPRDPETALDTFNSGP